MPVREGKLTCTSCHNPHGTPNPAQLKQTSVNENCYSCHTERRGPFLYEHPPAVDNCTNCHEPHGTVNDRLLKVTDPRVCTQCHMITGHPVTPRGKNSVFFFNRSCTNCHSQIHGSNHPSGTILYALRRPYDGRRKKIYCCQHLSLALIISLTSAAWAQIECR